MGKSDSTSSKRESKKTVRWVVTIFVITLFVSGAISLLSEELLSRSGMAAAFVILFVIVLVGILFDVVGVAVTSADERPFHSMAARKVPGAQEAISLLRNAERVGSICNDVVGDICGVISGSASAVIASKIISHFTFSWPNLISLLMSALVAATTVGGKAIGKSYAIQSCTVIVHQAGKVIAAWYGFLNLFRKKRNR
ncbi:MAG: hypothetical protein SOX71_03410 [Candidatus Faecousia sp.]|nr:hypothetical protein [Candidatus Faecousia sp.]